MHAILDILTGIAYNASMNANPSLGNRLKVARAERELSQEQLARLVGVTRQTISAVETRQYVPSALLAFLLAARLGKAVDELFYLQGDDA
jgi:putative transcriptional regulator